MIGSRRGAWILAALFLAYFLAGKVGLRLAFAHPSATPVWAPTGIAIGAVLLYGARVWPAIFAAAFLVNLTTAGTAATSLGIAVGNTLEALVAGALVRRYANGREAFADPRSVFRFALFAGLLAPVVSATIGVGTLALGGLVRPADLATTWITWWLGDGSGALLVTPLVLVWLGRPLPAIGPSPRRLRQALEGLGLAACIVGSHGLVYAGLLPAGFGFASTPLLVWAAFRFGLRTSATALVIVATLTVLGTLNGHGPFARGTVNESLLLLQTYMAVIAVTSQAMSAAVLQRRQAGEEVARFAGQLEAEVATRTAELARRNEQLQAEIAERRKVESEREALLAQQVASREAERANRQKDEFLATLSHELRTPLGAIVGWAELLRHADIDAEGRARAVEAIERNVRLQTRLISDLLDISRIAAGKLEISLQRVDPAALVEHAIEVVRPQMRARNIEVVTTLPVVTRPIVGDPERLQQVIGNLLSNALKFAPEGGRVEVGLRLHATLLEVTVADNGPGIDEALLPFVFERFRQGDSSSTRRHGGLGLGLSIAQHIVERHGGVIEAGRREGGGALFTVRLPVGSTEGMWSERPGAGEVDGERILRGALLAGVRVLVVDDDAGSREIAAEVLARCGADATTLGSPERAIETLRHQPFDVVVTDLAMPGEDGYAFLARVRSLPGGLATPVMALTALAGPETEARARRAGFDAFIAKPVRPAVLVSAIAALARSSAVRPG